MENIVTPSEELNINTQKKDIQGNKAHKIVSALVSGALLAGSTAPQVSPNLQDISQTHESKSSAIINENKKTEEPFEYIPTLNILGEPINEYSYIEGNEEKGDQENLIELAPGRLDLTKEWSADTKYIEALDGKAEIVISLFLDKSSDLNYGKKEAPDGRSTLIWNATEAVYRFGEVVLAPGDEISFRNRIEFGEEIPKKILIQDKKRKEEYNQMSELVRKKSIRDGYLFGAESQPKYKTNISRGDGYIEYGSGACFAATVMGEAFGLSLMNEKGETIPLFKADVGAIQGHSGDGTDYYERLYHGPGVGINGTEYGKLIFQLNPELPSTVRVTLKMGINDTNPEDPNTGTFSPVIEISIDGIPDEWSTIESMRLTGNRKEVLENVTGRGW